MSKYYLTVVYEVDGAVAARTILDARPWKASSHAHAIHDCDAARLEIASLHAQLEAIGAGGVEPLRQRECLHQISEPGQAQPVAAQSKFIDAAEWAQCSVEHAQMVLAKPSEWAGYEVRYLYAAPQPAAPAQPVAPDFDVSTTAGGRGYVAWLFSSVLRRYDFHDYINNVLAADFACALAKWLSTAPQPAAQALDAKRLSFLYSRDRTDSSAVLEMEIDWLNGRYPTLEQVRDAIDAAIAAQQGGA